TFSASLCPDRCTVGLCSGLCRFFLRAAVVRLRGDFAHHSTDNRQGFPDFPRCTLQHIRSIGSPRRKRAGLLESALALARVIKEIVAETVTRTVALTAFREELTQEPVRPQVSARPFHPRPLPFATLLMS
ncbi:unnamed protein product, partial [Ectocarpus sp. 8 AP-2014]